MMVRSASGVLGTIEVGNMNPRVGGDGEWKISGRDALMKVVDDRRPRARRDVHHLDKAGTGRIGKTIFGRR